MNNHVKLIIFYLILCLIFFTGYFSSPVYAENWQDINKNGFVHLPPLDLDAPCSANGAFQSYFDFYNLNIPAAKHYFGSFRSNGYIIAANIFIPEKHKATLFLMHGYFDHTGILKDTIHFFVKKGYTVAVYDMPGHGLSSGERVSIGDLRIYSSILNDFVTLCQSQIPSPAHIIAHSTGCSAVIDFILTTEDVPFDKVILIAPLVRSYGWYLSKTGVFICNPFFKNIPRKFGKNSSNSHFLQFVKNDDPLQYKKVPLQWPRALFKWNGSIQDYKVSSKKILIIQGKLDKTVAWKYNLKILKQKFPNLEIKMIKNGRHHLLNESPVLQKRIFNLILANIRQRSDN
ncbi:MAG: alpha/beta hydrolase [Deltaproteobacteria bacterium]|nr:alpha/beta hydrolase [Deltaproteobacteria bacterium]